jgi:hypothetical protein
MRAAELIAPLTFRHIDLPIEDPGPGEVQVSVEAVGVCGSDLYAYHRGLSREHPECLPDDPWSRAGGKDREDRRWCQWTDCGRPRRARAGALLLSLRVLFERAPQRLRAHTLSEQSSPSWFLP